MSFDLNHTKLAIPFDVSIGRFQSFILTFVQASTNETVYTSTSFTNEYDILIENTEKRFLTNTTLIMRLSTSHDEISIEIFQ